MKSPPASPVTFLEPSAKPPERCFTAGLGTPFGHLSFAGTERCLVRVAFGVPAEALAESMRNRWDIVVTESFPPLASAAEELLRYCHEPGHAPRCSFLPVNVTPFTLVVLRVIAGIPHGETLTYGEAAALAGKPAAARATGGACGHNPLPLFIPCHRVVAADGIGGFGSGTGLKRRLLAHEGVTDYQS